MPLPDGRAYACRDKKLHPEPVCQHRTFCLDRAATTILYGSFTVSKRIGEEQSLVYLPSLAPENVVRLQQECLLKREVAETVHFPKRTVSDYLEARSEVVKPGTIA